jgi:hypothetical protein
MLTSFSKANGQSFQMSIIDGNVYMYEYAIKRPGRANFGFIIVEGNSCQDISFDIHYSKGKINSVKQTVSSVCLSNSITKKLGSFYYDSDGFAKKNRLIPDNIYKIISPSFLEVTNKERLEILKSL